MRIWVRRMGLVVAFGLGVGVGWVMLFLAAFRASKGSLGVGGGR